MNIAVIEDEKQILDSILTIVQKYVHGYNVIGTASDATNAYKLLSSNNIDIALCDINIGENTIFDVLEKLPSISFKLVFITAHEKYALKAIKLSAFDFLLKPIDPLELIETLNRLKSIQFKENENAKAKTLSENLKTDSTKKVILKTAERIQIVEINEIVHIESDGSYSIFYLTNHDKIMVSKLIKEYDDLLNEYGFFRTHQSHLVNLQFINSFEKVDGGYLLMKNGSQIPVSQRKRDSLLHTIEQL